MRASGLSDEDGSHRNMVKSSEPDASRSGRPHSAASYLGFGAGRHSDNDAGFWFPGCWWRDSKTEMEKKGLHAHSLQHLNKRSL